MSVRTIDDNQVTIVGEMISSPAFSHEVFRERFYTFDIKVKRISGEEDVLPVIMPESVKDTLQGRTEGFIKVNGQYRSCNRQEGGKIRLILFVYAKEIEFTEAEPDATGANCIVLEGHLCKMPAYRKTPLGRWISDILLAVNRPYGKSAYIPCICWGRNAKIASDLEIGSHIKITGRIQSREYTKKLTETESEKRIAYEVCVKTLDVSMDITLEEYIEGEKKREQRKQ